MKSVIPSEVKEVMDAVHYRPAVSVILPFDPKWGTQAELQQEIKYVFDKVERRLADEYPAELYKPVLKKLKHLTEDLKYVKGKKGIALYASPVFEKLLFLDAPVEAKILIDESFEIRDLIYSKKEEHHYLLFCLSSERCKAFLGQNEELTSLHLESPDHLDAYWHKEPQRVANFSDPEDYKEAQVEKFIRQMDKELSHLLHTHQLPLFVTGSKSILGVFKSVSHNTKHVNKFIEGNYEEASVPELQVLVQPALDDVRRAKELQFLHMIEEAANEKKLATGIQNVWHEVYQKNGRLLVVEKNFIAAGEHISDGIIAYKPTGENNNFNQSHDVVDDAIELALKNGGDVAFVGEGMLTSYDHIALIKFYPS